MRAWVAMLLVTGAGACGTRSESRPVVVQPAPATVIRAQGSGSAAVGASEGSGAARLVAVQPWIGISLEAGTRGVRVKIAIEGTPGARAGLAAGDEVLSIDGVPTTSPRELIATVGRKGVGTHVALVVFREGSGSGTGAERRVELVLEAKPELAEIVRRKVVGKPVPAVPIIGAFGPYPVGSFQELAGKVVVVELGASWCGFCRATLPRLAAWQRDLGGRGLRVLWLSSEELEVIRAIDPAITDVTRARDPDGRLAIAMATQALPTFLVVDRAGIVRAAHLGAGEATLELIEASVLELLAEPTTSP